LPSGVPDGSGATGLSVQPVDGGLELRNDTDKLVSYRVVEREFARQSAAPCPHCPCLECTLSPGTSVVVPHGEIVGYLPGAQEAMVAWWAVTVDDTGARRLDLIETVVVRL
jgi:hypothetical protein